MNKQNKKVPKAYIVVRKITDGLPVKYIGLKNTDESTSEKVIKGLMRNMSDDFFFDDDDVDRVRDLEDIEKLIAELFYYMKFDAPKSILSNNHFKHVFEKVKELHNSLPIKRGHDTHLIRGTNGKS